MHTPTDSINLSLSCVLDPFILSSFCLLPVLAWYQTNGLSKPTMFRSKLPTQAHLVFESSLLRAVSFHRPLSTGNRKGLFIRLSSRRNFTVGVPWLCGGFWILRQDQSLLNQRFCKPSHSHQSCSGYFSCLT